MGKPAQYKPFWYTGCRINNTNFCSGACSGTSTTSGFWKMPFHGHFWYDQESSFKTRTLHVAKTVCRAVPTIARRKLPATSHWLSLTPAWCAEECEEGPTHGNHKQRLLHGGRRGPTQCRSHMCEEIRKATRPPGLPHRGLSDGGDLSEKSAAMRRLSGPQQRPPSPPPVLSRRSPTPGIGSNLTRGPLGVSR
jgi:hypothetical protein